MKEITKETFSELQKLQTFSLFFHIKVCEHRNAIFKDVALLPS